ncbi:MAG: hypothetical protein ACRDD8_06105 [Bacteroidales bacterium]
MVKSCIEALSKKEGGLITDTLIVDYCVRQAHIWRDMTKYKQQWNVNYAFGARAIERYYNSAKGLRHFEDRWLCAGGLSRDALRLMITAPGEHPMQKYVFIEAEERTKFRLINTEFGFAVCEHSTLLWSPLSPACSKCNYTEKCRTRTQKLHPELYRIRLQNK